MLKLILSPDWVANRAMLLAELAEQIAQGQEGQILLVPEQISHDSERELCALAGDKASRYAQVLSFTRLASRVFAMTGGAARQVMDQGGRIIAMAAAVEQVRPRLKAYAAVSTKPEFLTQLVEAVDQCKSCCIAPADLADAARRCSGALAQKLEELALLLQGYDAVCAMGYLDPRDRMTKLLEQLEDSDFGENHRLYIDGFTDFTAQELGVLDYFLQSSRDLTVSLACSTPGSVEQGQDIAGHTARLLLRAAEKRNVPVQILHPKPRQDALAPVRRGLFSGKTELVAKENLTVFTVDSPWWECLFAGRRIQELVAGGVRYREISVAYTDGGKYGPILEMVLSNLGIACYRSGAEDILHKAVIHVAVSALEAAVGGMEQNAVLRYLKSALSPLAREDCDLLENYVILWGITGSGWAQTWTRHPEGRGREPDEGSQALLERLNEMRLRAVAPLIALGQKIGNAKSTRQQILALYGFLSEIEMERRLSLQAAEMTALGDHKTAQELSQLWELLISALEQMEQLLGDTVRDGDGFARLLRLQLGQYDVGTIPPVLDRITMGELSAMRRKKVRHLIVLGAEEGALPGYGSSGGVLTQRERDRLVAMGLGLTGGRDWNLQQDFATIQAVFSCPEESLAVCCSGREPSYLFRRLCCMAESQGGTAPLEDWRFDPSAAAAALVRAGKQQELPERWKTILRGCAYSRGNLSQDSVTALYGRELMLSASQVDQLAMCRLAYFLKYGLRAQERKDNSVEPTEFGTFVHEVLEKTARDVMAEGGFHHVSLERTRCIAKEHAEGILSRMFDDLEESSRRGTYLFRRNLWELEQVVTDLWQELSRSEFVPTGFEVAFGPQPEALPPISIRDSKLPARLRGFVDRMDQCVVDGKQYVRVVDYKTGKKDFDYCDVENGIGLQMLLYLFALEQSGKGAPAGVVYFPARAPVLSVSGPVSDEEAGKLRQKEVRRNGLVLDHPGVLEAMEPGEEKHYLPVKVKKDGSLTGDLASPGQFDKLEQYLQRQLKDLADQIAGGEVSPNPYFRGDHNACRFCDYAQICQGEGQEHRRSFRAISPGEFWSRVEKEEEDHG